MNLKTYSLCDTKDNTINRKKMVNVNKSKSLYLSPAICLPIHTHMKKQNLLKAAISKVYHVIVPSKKPRVESANSIILPAY